MRTMVGGFLVLCFVFGLHAENQYEKWTDSTRIFLNTSVGGVKITEELVKFPVLLRITSPNFSKVATVAPGGADLRFSKPDGTPLNYEIENWKNGVGGNVWVLVDTVYPSRNDQFFVMFWGNQAVASESDGKRVFDTANGYGGVWHMRTNEDATAYARNGIRNKPCTDTAGAIGNGQRFAESYGDSLVVPVQKRMHGAFTISAWGKVMGMDFNSGTYLNVMSYIDPTIPYAGYAMQMFQAMLEISVGLPSSWNYYDGVISPRKWHYCVGTMRDGILTFYVNGVCVGRMDGLAFTIDPARPGVIGGAGEANYNTSIDMAGWVDEVRELSVVKSDSWILAEYINQNPDQIAQSFVRFGSQSGVVSRPVGRQGIFTATSPAFYDITGKLVKKVSADNASGMYITTRQRIGSRTKVAFH